MVLMVQFLTACLHHVERRAGTSLREVDRDAAVLKVHLRNGELLVLAPWKASPETGMLTGTGQRWNVARQLVADGQHVVALHDVVIFETNSRRSSLGPNITLGVLSVTSAAVMAALTLITFWVLSDSSDH